MPNDGDYKLCPVCSNYFQSENKYHKCAVTPLENEVVLIRNLLDDVSERVRVSVVAREFLKDSSNWQPRNGTYFLLDGDHPTRLSNISSDGKWTYYDRGGSQIEPFKIPDTKNNPRLYTVEEVAEILSIKMSR